MAPASDATTVPSPAARQVVLERPEAGLAQGQYAWPAWAIVCLGGAILVVAIGFLLQPSRAPHTGRARTQSRR